MRLPLIGGAYTTRSVIGSAQRAINYYPEPLPKHLQHVVPMTHYQRPGLVPQATIGPGPIRGLFQLSDGSGYCVSGDQMHRINPDWSSTFMGNITTLLTNPVSMTDNGTNWVLVDGSNQGWTGLRGGTDFALVVDPNVEKTFEGADRVDFIDTYIVFNVPDSPFFGSTLGNQIAFQDPALGPKWWAGKTGWPDDIETIYVNRHEIILLGRLKGEVWYDAGNAGFPFARVPGAYIEHGMVARYSIAHHDTAVFWLGQDLLGHGVVLKFEGYKVIRISNYALEFAIRQMGPGIANAIGYSFQMDGHVFYVLTFPDGDQTWVYDAGIEDTNLAWHQECCANADGSLHRHRGRCHAVINGLNVVGDHTNGTIYRLDLNVYTDTIEGQVRPITCIRSFPHLGQARLAGAAQPVSLDGRRVQFAAFELDLECGTAPLDIGGQEAKVILRWSDDRGKTWGTDVLQTAGQPGVYNTWPLWRGLGIARDRVFEIQHSIAGPAALQGAFVDAEVAGT